MFVVTDSKNNNVCVLDTNDSVEEWHTIDELREYVVERGVRILGLLYDVLSYVYPYKGIKYFYCRFKIDFMLVGVTSTNSIFCRRVTEEDIEGLCSCELYEIYKFDFDSYRGLMALRLDSLRMYEYEYFNKYYNTDKFILAKCKLTGQNNMLLQTQKFKYTLRLDVRNLNCISETPFVFSVSYGCSLSYLSLESNKFETCYISSYQVKNHSDGFANEYYRGLAESLDNYHNYLKTKGFSFCRNDMEFSVSLSFLEQFIVS